jgi:glycosyltransferase involved in cell wall biosynthesis
MNEVQPAISVLHLASPLTIAGAERVILNYLDYHDRDHFRLHVAAFINERKIASNPFPNEVRARSVDTRVISICKRIDLRDVARVIVAIRQTGARILHTHGYRADVVGLLAARICRIRTIATIHGWTPVTTSLRLYERADLLALRFFDRIIAVSDMIHQGFVETGIHHTRVLTLNNAVPPPDVEYAGKVSARLREDTRREFGLAADDFVIGIIGRLSEEKGVRYFLDSLSLLKVSGLRAKALIVGDGPDAELLRRYSRTLGLQDSAIFAGFRIDIAPIYAAVDCIALPSLTEGIPMVILEAFAHDRPVVATRVGGVPEVITDGSDGFLVEPCRPDLMAEKIMRLAGDRELRAGVTARGRVTLSTRFDPVVWARKIEDVYRSVLV